MVSGFRQQCAEFANIALGDIVLRATSQNEKELVTFLHLHFIMTFQETKKNHNQFLTPNGRSFYLPHVLTLCLLSKLKGPEG